jgi:hypothetical protein
LYANNQEGFHHSYSFEIVEFAIMLLLGGKQIIIRHWWKDGPKIPRVRMKQVSQEAKCRFFWQKSDVFQEQNHSVLDRLSLSILNIFSN